MAPDPENVTLWIMNIKELPPLTDYMSAQEILDVIAALSSFPDIRYLIDTAPEEASRIWMAFSTGLTLGFHSPHVRKQGLEVIESLNTLTQLAEGLRSGENRPPFD